MFTEELTSLLAKLKHCDDSCQNALVSFLKVYFEIFRRVYECVYRSVHAFVCVVCMGVSMQRCMNVKVFACLTGLQGLL